MAPPRLAPCLVQLRTELNQLFPGRDTKSDGWIGDPAHQARKSDHNPDDRGIVHAFDADADLLTDGHTMIQVVRHQVARCRSGVETRLAYIIHNRTIWEWTAGWLPKPYTGSNPHAGHAHFSARHVVQLENDQRPWMNGYPMLTNPDRDWLTGLIRAEIKAALGPIAEGVWNHTEPNPYDNGATNRRMGGDLRMMEFRDDQRAAATSMRLDMLTKKVEALRVTLDRLRPHE